MERLRVLTLNIWNRQGPWEARLALIRRGIAELQPDLVALQEVLHHVDAPSDQANEIAEGLGLTATFGSAWHIGGGLHFGNAVLSRFPVAEKREWQLPGEDGEEIRALLHVMVDAPCGRIPFYVTHLDWKLHQGALRLRQVQFIADRVAETASAGLFPTVLAGDFNAEPASDEIRYLRGYHVVDGKSVYFADCFDWHAGGDPGHTFARRNGFAARAHEPDRRLDYIFVRGPDKQLRGEPAAARVVLDQPDGEIFPSDHFGVFAELYAAPRAMPQMARAWAVDGIEGDTEVVEAAPKIIAVRLAEVAHYRGRTLTRVDPEDLHDMRVATRRLRAALRLIGGKLAHAERAVKVLGDALGRVRDLDVLIEWLVAARAHAEPDEFAGIDALTDETRAALPSVEAAMREAVDAYSTRLEPVLTTHLGAAGFKKPLGGRTVRRTVARRVTTLGRRIINLASVDDVEAVHDVRIAGKKARYDLELIEPALGAPAADALTRLRRLQELVGEVHDRDVRLALLPPRIAGSSRPEQPGLVRLLRDSFNERRKFAVELSLELDEWRDGGVADALARHILDS